MKFKPENDGIDHINIYSKGKTELGRLLSNFAFVPLYHSKYGSFNSVEGFWYWLKTPSNNPRKDELRKLYGFRAKQLGRELGAQDWDETKMFKALIIEMLEIKYEQSFRIQELIKNTKLPFVHYYVYGEKVIEPKEGRWIIDFWESKKQFELK